MSALPIVETRTVVTYENAEGKTQHWVPPVVLVDGQPFVKITAADKGFARFCGINKTLRDVTEPDESPNAQNPWVSTTFLQLLKRLRKEAVDKEILKTMRSRNNAPDMELPRRFLRTKESIEANICEISLPEVAHQGVLCEPLDALVIASKDNREAVCLSCTAEVVQWLQIAARASCEDDAPKDDLRRKRRLKSERLEVPSELQHMVKTVRYDRHNIACKYNNSDGAEVMVTVKPVEWTDDSIADALSAFAERRRALHHIEVDGKWVLGTSGSPSTPPAYAPHADD